MLLLALIVIAVVILALVIVSVIGVARVESRFPPQGRFVAVTGGRLHVLDRPAREAEASVTVVLLHGASGNLADIDLALGEPLSRRHRVIAIDRPGHGWSDRPGGADDAAPARQAALIAEALAALGVDRAVVVGHSLAGAVAARLALDHGSLVSGLVLLSGVTHPWPGGVAWQNTVVSTPVAGTLLVHALAYPLGALLIDKGVAAVFHPHGPPEGYVERARIPLLLRPGPFRANAQDISGLKAFVTEQAPRYGAIRVPASVITADKDHVVSPDIHSRTIAGQIEGARLVVVPGAGHMPHHTATEIVLREIEAVAEAAR